ncbi:DUF2946 domain-containing protein [Stutzerimonas stutzeri]|uniref:DUF2946 domain-containing protein n=1 Tax=Stutzerimonas stutzeri TaxID=316 RepID=A0A2N8T6D8_STUST|nr:DUF2946 domain-containing protein [Stutzerimonas stutzeri]MCQ4325528.1 DUF2946 domain-containing protein [Stutzerimonas stutzeri]PNG10252.1 DUF2946 domain-containing protein [Stutzerimonas stutzeri]
MTIVKDKRARIVWVLLTCILINAFVCSLNHATHVGFGLAMGQDAFCLSDDSSSGASALPADVHGLSEHAFDCPLCSSVFLGIVVLLALAWLGQGATVAPRLRQPERLGPRHHWPALNPRAP